VYIPKLPNSIIKTNKQKNDTKKKKNSWTTSKVFSDKIPLFMSKNARWYCQSPISKIPCAVQKKMTSNHIKNLQTISNPQK
jgi:hypothetical protein